MNLKIGEMIFKLRKELHLTQEQLATAVGVSTVAVSKWENDQTYPDITLLPPLARILNTSVDILLAYEKDLSIEEVLALEKQCADVFESQALSEAFNYCEKLLKQYPNSLYLKFRLAYLYQQYLTHATDEAQMMKIIDDAIQLFEAAATSEDFEIMQAANIGLSSLYMMTQKYDESITALNNIPKVVTNPDMLLSSILYVKGEKEEAKKLTQQVLFKDIQDSLLNLNSLASMARKEENLELALDIANKSKIIIDTFELQSISNPSYYLMMADLYSTMKNEDATLSALESLIDELPAIMAEANLKTSTLFDLMNIYENTVTKDNFKFNLTLLLNHSENFDFIKSSPRYEALIQKLNN